MDKPLAPQSRIYIETEENEVVVLDSEPAKSSALSKENDCYDYLVENEFGQVFWITNDKICVDETKGEFDKKL